MGTAARRPPPGSTGPTPRRGAGAATGRAAVARLALEPRDREPLRRLREVQQVVRNPRPLRGGGFRGADVHPPVHEHRVDRDDLQRRARSASAIAGLGLAAGGRARPARGSITPRRGAAAPATTPPSRWCAAASVISRVDEGAGRQRLAQVHDPVRPGPRLRRAVASSPSPSTSTSTVRPDLRAVPLRGDRRPAARRAGRTAPGRPPSAPGRPSSPPASRAAASTGTCRRCRTRHARRPRACRRSPPRSRPGSPR